MSPHFTYMLSKAFSTFPSTTRSWVNTWMHPLPQTQYSNRGTRWSNSYYRCLVKFSFCTMHHSFKHSKSLVAVTTLRITHQQSGPRNHVAHRHFIKQVLRIFQRPNLCVQVQQRVGNQPHAVGVNRLAESQSLQRWTRAQHTDEDDRIGFDSFGLRVHFGKNSEGLGPRSPICRGPILVRSTERHRGNWSEEVWGGDDVVVGEVEVEERVLDLVTRFEETRVDFECFGARVVEGAGLEGVGEGVVVVEERVLEHLVVEVKECIFSRRVIVKGLTIGG